jgi:hypothetical protein
MPSLSAPAPRSLTWPRLPTEPMNASHDLIAVFGGIFGLLAVFSLIGAGLKYGSPGASPTASSTTSTPASRPGGP